MNVLNKLRTTVSGALPGNPLIRDYDISKSLGSAGPGLLWKLYAGNKKTTKQEVTMWVMEKKSLDCYNRHDRELILEVLRHGVAQLTRLRHPRVLAVLAPLEESRESLAFATEPVVASLSNLVHSRAAATDSASSETPSQPADSGFEPPDEVEIRYGVYQVTEALAFLHNDCRQVHGGLSAEAILVNKAGSWKLAGFDFSATATALQSSVDGGEPVFTVPEWQSNVPYVAQPSLDSISPEAALRGSAGPSSDIFALAMLLITLYGHGKSLYQCRNELAVYRRNIQELKSLRLNVLQRIPENLREYVKLMLNPEPTLRPDAHQFNRIPFFDDASTRTLQSLDNLYQLDNLAKSQFYKQLPGSLKVLPKRVLMLRVYPQLADDFANPNMVPFVLPAVLQIVEATTEQEFREQILPRLLPVFSLSEPIHIALICMQNLTILLTKCPADDVKNHVLPMMTRSLDSSNPLLQEVCLSTLPTVGHMMDYSILKNSVIPKVKKLCLRTSNSEMRVRCLMSIGKLMEHMDRWFVLDEILPMLPDIKSRDPPLVMAILGIYRVAFSHKKLGITKEMLATKILPQLLPLCIEPNMTLPQFGALMGLVKEMVARVEDEQRGKLQQLHNIQEEQKTLMNAGTTPAGGDMRLNGQARKAIAGSEGKSTSMMEQFMLGMSPDSVNASLAGPLFDASSALGFTDELESTSGTAVSLSLEAKQRLAAKAEQAGKMNKAVNSTGGRLAPLNAPPSRPALPAPKDLTSTLMERNLASMALCPVGRSQQPPSGAFANANPFTQNSNAVVPMGSQMQPPQMQPPQNPQRSQVDMTPLDNLFGNSQGSGRNPSINEMRAITYPGQPAWQPVTGMTQVAPPAMGGVPMMSQQPYMSPLTQFQQQQQQQPRTTTTPALNSQDINDLLG